MEGRYFFEGAPRSDGIDAQKALTGAHVLVTHGRIFFLPSCVKNIKQTCFVVNSHLFSVRILNCRIIFIDKVVLDELYREGRFANTTTTNNYQFVFCHLVRLVVIKVEDSNVQKKEKKGETRSG